jgi:hypothetical protein
LQEGPVAVAFLIQVVVRAAQAVQVGQQNFPIGRFELWKIHAQSLDLSGRQRPG